MLCDKHGSWDSDKEESCPLCFDEKYNLGPYTQEECTAAFEWLREIALQAAYVRASRSAAIMLDQVTDLKRQANANLAQATSWHYDSQEQWQRAERAETKLKAESDRRTKNLYKWNEEVHELDSKLQAANAQIEALREVQKKNAKEWKEVKDENEALRTDAERYRWVRAHRRVQIFPLEEWKVGVTGRALDAAIDAAMGKEKP
jgi:DNA repair exonuclease SbcCD ATPase subunit